MRPRADDRGVVPIEDFERFFTELGPHIQGIDLNPVRWSNLPSPHMTLDHMFRLTHDIARTKIENKRKK